MFWGDFSGSKKDIEISFCTYVDIYIYIYVYEVYVYNALMFTLYTPRICLGFLFVL